MGEEIARGSFDKGDFEEYRRRLVHETELLGRCLSEGRFRPCEPVGGYEVEACLVDKDARPAPVNDTFLAHVNSRYLVPELARFNVEINAPPRPLRGRALREMEQDLTDLRTRCDRVASELGVDLLLIGILPTLADGDLTLANMSSQERYRALNEQIFRLRHGRPIVLDIDGRDPLRTTHHDVMLESAATSFQIHLKVTPAKAARYYNLAVALSAPLVAVSANSPYLFGHDLWDETRIPLFEQSVQVANGRDAPQRVTLGRGYAGASLMECFTENLSAYAVLLPTLKETPDENFAHLRLHNGTIWRWNRPLVGFDADGRPHLRIEHRVMPAGPSLTDSIANAAFFFGLMQALGDSDPPLEAQIPFATARRNFYAAARYGLRANIEWIGGRTVSVAELLRAELLPAARRGAVALGLEGDDMTHYLGVIAGRVATGRNGAAWQRAYVERHGRDMSALTLAYRERQRAGAPVHEWVL